MSTIANTDVHTRAVYIPHYLCTAQSHDGRVQTILKKLSTSKIVRVDLQRITHHVRSAALWVRERESARTKHDGTSVGKSVIHWASLGNLLFTALSLG